MIQIHQAQHHLNKQLLLAHKQITHKVAITHPIVINTAEFKITGIRTPISTISLVRLGLDLFNQTGGVHNGKLFPFIVAGFESKTAGIRINTPHSNGSLEVGPIDNNWASAMWKLEPAQETGGIQNSWQTDKYINNDAGKLQAGPIQPNWASAL
ncbi:MAG: hypothetical protein IPI60_04680 [Saprospiraceae bacterium]|nr:hypothetical protein [Saprospiraceae bacterium]